VTAGLAAVDRAIADLQQRQERLAKHLALFTDPDAAGPIIREIEALRAQEPALNVERERVFERFRVWEAMKANLVTVE
jgi:hypothetical protein